MMGPSCQLILNIKNLNFEDVTFLISDITFLSQAHPYNF